MTDALTLRGSNGALIGSPRAPQIAFIQLLRGLAVLIVVWSHLSGFWLLSNARTWPAQDFFQAWIVIPFHIFQNGGHLGVVLFFLVSGFIITHTSLRETQTAFVVKRLFRIFPPLLAALVLTWVLLKLSVSIGVPLIGIQGGSVLHWLAAVFMMDGFIPGARILGPTWTLAIELAFYSLTFVMLSRSRSRPLAATWQMILIWGVMSVGAMNLPPAVLGDNPALMPLISWLLIGRVVYLMQRSIVSSLDGALMLGVLGLAYVLFEEAMAPGQLFLPGGWAGVEPIVSDAIALVSFLVLMRVENLRVPRILNFLGNISYSLYLVHVPIGITVLNLLNLVNMDFTISFFLAVVASIAGAYIIFILVERPSQGLARSVLRRLKQQPVIRVEEPEPLT